MTSKQRQHDVTGRGSLGFAAHDHRKCVNAGLAAAERVCAEKAIRLTPVRRKTLEIWLREHRALGAYAILDQLREAGFGSQPPVAYRALEFLTDQGFAHKIERLNAFVACNLPDEDHSPAFMICRMCDAVAEAQAAPSQGELNDVARAAGFKIERTVVEVEGVCPLCADAAQP